MAIKETPTTENNLLSEYVKKNKFVESEDCPVKNSELNWIFKQRAYNGFKEAFVKFSSRGYLVHVPTFVKILASKRGQ